MTPLVEHLLFNAVAATTLAPLAYASKYLGRPALTHALWLVVLARLIAPPLYTLTWKVSDGPPPVVGAITTGQDFSPLVEVEPPIIEDAFLADWTESPDPKLTQGAAYAFPWLSVILGAWAAGTAFVLLVAFGRATRFSESIAAGLKADHHLAERVACLSRRLGQARPPRIKVVCQRLSPCVWAGLFRPTLVLPVGWLGRLSPLQQAAVIVHELAHLRRRDHLTRWLEICVSALYWWHPVVWLASRELHEAEELCCDGWVIATLPAARRAYADALVDTLDFLAPPQPALPPFASGLGQVHELKRRIHMILKSKPSHRAGWIGALAALTVALALPIGVARGDEPQDNPPQPPRGERREERRIDFEDRERALAEAERARARAVRARDDAEGTEIDRLRDELRKAEEQMAQAQQRIERLRRRMEELGVKTPRPAGVGAAQPRAPGGGVGGGGGFGAFGGERPRMNEGDAEKIMLKLRLQEIELREKLGEDHPDVHKIRKQLDEVKRAAAADRSDGPARREGPRGAAGPTPPVPPLPPRTPAPAGDAPRNPFGGMPPGAGGGDPRIDELTKAVMELRRAVDEMRRERERDRRQPPPNP